MLLGSINKLLLFSSVALRATNNRARHDPFASHRRLDTPTHHNIKGFLVNESVGIRRLLPTRTLAHLTDKPFDGDGLKQPLELVN